MENDISVCRVLFQSPFVIFNRPDLQEDFFEMLRNTLAWRYKCKSWTTLLTILPLLSYLLLCIFSHSFIKLPYFAVEPFVLTPYRLQQFEFYRLYSSPFIFNDLNETLLNSLFIWIIGSYVEDIYGWKILVVFVGLPGLVGATCSIIPMLVGMCCASAIIDWSDSRTEVFQRRIQLVVYMILAFLFFLILICLERSVRIAISSSLV